METAGGKRYRIHVRSLMFRAVRRIRKGFVAAGRLANVRLFARVRAHVNLEILESRERLCAAVELKQ